MSKYFFRFEKIRAKKVLTRINVEGEIIEDCDEILDKLTLRAPEVDSYRVLMYQCETAVSFF